MKNIKQKYTSNEKYKMPLQKKALKQMALRFPPRFIELTCTFSFNLKGNKQELFNKLLRKQIKTRHPQRSKSNIISLHRDCAPNNESVMRLPHTSLRSPRLLCSECQTVSHMIGSLSWRHLWRSRWNANIFEDETIRLRIVISKNECNLTFKNVHWRNLAVRAMTFWINN